MSFGRNLAMGVRGALFWCVIQGYPDVLRALLERGADVGQRNPRLSSGNSPLALAVSTWRSEETLVLLQNGAWEREPEVSREDLLDEVRSKKGIAKAFRDAGISIPAA